MVLTINIVERRSCYEWFYTALGRNGGLKRKRWKIGIPAVLIALAVFFNILARVSKGFSEFYVNQIFPVWVETYGRVTGLFSFSVGEWMLYLAVGLVVILVLAGVVTLAVRRVLPGWWKRAYKGYAMFLYWVFGIVCVIMTWNCFLLYQAPVISERFAIGGRPGREYGIEEIGILRDYVVTQANELSVCFQRDEKGYIIYDMDMEAEAIAQMQSLASLFPNLEGYYPRPKQFTFSGFFSQQKMKGYFFPFSMEVNYNKLMHEINRPATICHEYAHLKGFMYEEEANMIGFLACIHSSDLTFQYSGYLSVLNYIDNEFYKAIGKNKEIYLSHVNISPRVRKENIFLEKDAWEKVEARAVISTEVVDKVSDKLSETSMVLNGVEDGTLSYTRVIGLLLHYYDGSPEVEETLLQAQAIPADPETTSETPSKITSVMNTIEVQENTY